VQGLAGAKAIALDFAPDLGQLRDDLAPRIPLAFANAKKKGAPVPLRPDAPFSYRGSERAAEADGHLDTVFLLGVQLGVAGRLVAITEEAEGLIEDVRRAGHEGEVLRELV